MSTTRPDASLRRLRRRLWAGFAAVSLLAIVMFAAVLLAVETSERRDRQDARLRGRADRGAALMYETAGRPMVDAVADDSVSEGPPGIAVFGGTGQGLYRSAALPATDTGDLLTLVRRSLRDAAETGRSADLGPLRAVALPWFGENDRVAGAVVAVAPRETYFGSDLLLPSVLGGLGLWLVLVATGWLVTGRSVRPAVEALRARETFLATAAHELRTPLARLRANAEATARPAELIAMADSATHVVDNLLLAASIDWGEPVVRRRVQRVDTIVADLEYRDPAVVADVSSEVTLDVDEHLLRHALGNLIDNAVRHASGEAPLVLVRLRVTPDTVEIEVTDNGPGFPPGYTAPAHYRTNALGGTGLGLALVAWIADAHDAQLRLDNDPDGGGRVTISFPAPRAGLARSVPTPRRTAARRRDRRR